MEFSIGRDTCLFPGPVGQMSNWFFFLINIIKNYRLWRRLFSVIQTQSLFRHRGVTNSTRSLKQRWGVNQFNPLLESSSASQLLFFFSSVINIIFFKPTSHFALLLFMEQNFEVKADDLEQICELGRGAYGVVDKMRHVPSGLIMAVKASVLGPLCTSRTPRGVTLKLFGWLMKKSSLHTLPFYQPFND